MRLTARRLARPRLLPAAGDSRGLSIPHAADDLHGRSLGRISGAENVSGPLRTSIGALPDLNAGTRTGERVAAASASRPDTPQPEPAGDPQVHRGIATDTQTF